MKFSGQFVAFSLVFSAFFLPSVTVQAHTVFKKQMEKKYPTVKISCNACHVKGKKKTERNELGKLFDNEMKGQALTTHWKSKKGPDKKAYQTDVMGPAFLKALKIVKEKQNDAGETYHALIESVKLDGLKERPPADEEQ